MKTTAAQTCPRLLPRLSPVLQDGRSKPRIIGGEKNESDRMNRTKDRTEEI